MIGQNIDGCTSESLRNLMGTVDGQHLRPPLLAIPQYLKLFKGPIASLASNLSKISPSKNVVSYVYDSNKTICNNNYHKVLVILYHEI